MITISNMIYNTRKLPSGKSVDITPTPKQNKYLLSIGASNEYGINPNGYGYADKVRVYTLTRAQVREYNRIGATKTKPRPQLSKEEKMKKWAKRLAKLTGISLSEAVAIAEEKQDYKEQQISKMYDRECERASFRRQTLIRKMERENPLRRIEGVEHAEAILAASNRHRNTDYEYQLDEARESAEMGYIDRDEVKDYARSNYTTY